MKLTASANQAKNRAGFDGIGLLILILPPLFWAGNFVIGRAVREDIPPIALSVGRWVIAFLVLLPFIWRHIRQDMPLYWQYRWRILGISLTGISAFNTLVYLGLHSTTVTNGILLNSFIPILITLFSTLFYKQRLYYNQIAGMALSFMGVLVIILHGNWHNLISLTFAQGDLIIFIAMVCWALYTLWIRDFPLAIDKKGLMGVQIVLGTLFLLPFLAWELALGYRPHWQLSSVLGFAYVGILPSVVAYFLYILGVMRVGAIRAGMFIHLMPVFGTLLSMLFLDEIPQFYHLIGIAAILLGLTLSGRK